MAQLNRYLSQHDIKSYLVGMRCNLLSPDFLRTSLGVRVCGRARVCACVLCVCVRTCVYVTMCVYHCVSMGACAYVYASVCAKHVFVCLYVNLS